MYDKFQGCTVDVLNGTLILNKPRANPEICTPLNACHYAVHDVKCVGLKVSDWYSEFSRPRI